MRFDQLRTSMANNAREDPSLYMAVCMMESLVSDVEEECGTDFEKCVAGNERLPIKLLWLCRTIGAVYKEQQEAFTRSQDRLSDAITRTNEIQKELKNYADSAEKLADAEDALEKAEKELTSAKSQASEAGRLQQQAQKLEEEAKELRRFDPEKEHIHIKDLESEIAELQKAINKFRTNETEPCEARLNAAKAELNQKKKELAVLEQQCTEAQKQFDELILTIAASKKELENLNKEVDEQEKKRNEWQQHVQDAEERRDRLKGEVRTQIEALSKLQTESDTLEKVDLPEKALLVKAEKDRKQELEKRLCQADKEEKSLQDQNKELEKKCADAEKNLRSTQEKFDALTADLNGKTEELQDLDKKIHELEDKDVENKYETYLRQKEEKLKTLREQEKQSGQMVAEIQDLDLRLEKANRHHKELLDSKEKKTATENGLRDSIRKLSAVVTPEYLREISLLTERLVQLENTRTDLFATQEQLMETLKICKSEGGNILAEDAKHTLERFREFVENYRRKLVNCAKQLDDLQTWKENDE